MMMSRNDAEQYTTVTVSSQEIQADSGHTKLQPTSNPIFGEGNEDYVGKCATEATQQDALLSEMQGPSTSSLDENCNENTRNHAAGKDIVLANLQAGPGFGMPATQMDQTVIGESDRLLEAKA